MVRGTSKSLVNLIKLAQIRELLLEIPFAIECYSFIELFLILK